MQSQKGAAPDWEGLSRFRKEAEAAREAAILSQAEAERTREALAARMAELQQESQRADSIAEARARLQPGDRVVVPRLGYDRPGRVVKLDPRKKSAVIAIGHVTWNVAIDELIPQAIRAPRRPIHRPRPSLRRRNEPLFPKPATNDCRAARPSRSPYQETVGAFKNKTPSGGTLIERWNGRPACCSGMPQAPP